MTINKIISVQVGKTATYPAPGPGEMEWRSAIVKSQVEGPVWLDMPGLTGDEHADQKHHGGLQQAANVYPSEHYEFWRQTPGLENITGGGFGENITTAGLMEEQVCIGDVYRLGQAIVRVTQPRSPCYKLNRRWKLPDLMDRAIAQGFIGWYFAVQQPGYIQPGDSLELLDRPHPQWSIARVWSLNQDSRDTEAVLALTGVEGLSGNWREMFRKRL